MAIWTFNASSEWLPVLSPDETALVIKGSMNRVIAKQLAEFIRKNKQITTIIFSITFHEPQTLLAIAEALEENTTVTQIDFQYINTTNVFHYGCGQKSDLAHEGCMVVVDRGILTQAQSKIRIGHTLVMCPNPKFNLNIQISDLTSIEERNRALQAKNKQIPAQQQQQTDKLPHPFPKKDLIVPLLRNHQSNDWIQAKLLYGIGYTTMAIAGLSAIIMMILNAEWEENPYLFPEAAKIILGMAVAVYGIGAATHYATPREDKEKFLSATLYTLSAALFFATTAYLMCENFDDPSQLVENGTERVFASLYGTMCVSSLVATAAHTGKMVNPKI